LAATSCKVLHCGLVGASQHQHTSPLGAADEDDRDHNNKNHNKQQNKTKQNKTKQTNKQTNKQ